MQDLESQHDKSLQMLRKKLACQAEEVEEVRALLAAREQELMERGEEIAQMREAVKRAEGKN